MKKKIKAAIAFAWFVFIKTVIKIGLYSYYSFNIIGKENIPKKGSVLHLCNHQSFLDPLMCQSSCPRNISFVARESLFKLPFWGRLINSLGIIPIKRGQADLRSMRRIMDKLKEGRVVCLFPEGTRSEDGRISEIKPGLALLSKKTGSPVLPVVVDGPFECWSKHEKYPKRGKLTIMYGQLIGAEKVKELGNAGFAEFMTTKLRELQNQCREKNGKQSYDYSESVTEK